MTTATNEVEVARLADLEQRVPFGALVGNVDIVLVRDGDEVFALYGRCLHRGARLADGHVQGEDLICGVHGWDFRFRTGVSAYDNNESLPTFRCWVDGDGIFVDADEIAAWERSHPQAFDRDAYQGLIKRLGLRK